MCKKNLYHRIETCLLSDKVDEKIVLVEAVCQDFINLKLNLASYENCLSTDKVGFPDRPVLVAPKDLPKRKFHDSAGRAALIHAIAHIEFNAINLALDAAYRFRHMPEQYYADWLQVAGEEVKHFKLLVKRLKDFELCYGDLAAHRGLWDMAESTQNDLLPRMALVPRFLEARGLDVTPGMIKKLAAQEDHKSVKILEIILEEEVGHVQFGSNWFIYECEQRGLEPASTYFELIEQKLHTKIRGPFNLKLREQAGFSQEELRVFSDLG